MISLYDFINENVNIFELKDETYLSAAMKRKQQGRGFEDILKHSANMQIKNFIKELSEFEWFSQYVIPEKLNVYEQVQVYIEFVESMYCNHKDFDKATFNRIESDITNLCRKYGKLVHGVRLYCIYSNEAPHAIVSFLDRSNPLDIKSKNILYHVTTKESAIDSIKINGLTSQEKNNFSDSYTYKCVFALTKKAGIKEYAKMLNTKNGYYVISFEAGDNIYFNDALQNRQFYLQSSSSRSWDGVACFTLSDVSPEQIVSIDYYKGGKLVENVYTK